MHELPLVFFTVLGQSAAGLFFVAYLSNKLNLINNNQHNVANLLAMVVMFFGLAIGGLHVGQPIRFFNMLLGIGRSPMSNEAFFSGIFMALAVGTVVFSFFEKFTKLKQICNLAGVVAGLVFVWSIPQVYCIDTVANWNTHYTALQMWMTCFIGGGALATLIGAHKLGALFFIIGAMVILATKAEYISLLNAKAIDQTWFWGIQLVILGLSLFVMAAVVLQDNVPRTTLVACTVIIFVAELFGRIAFYNLWEITM
ncbi:dimethyl sulfoxide reductase anchor subunit family protein [Arsenophonus apicola]|uniref:dimethyl sulfoxide reductase anchor subunit family protein n=1 Tax=Arsenophonus apicola TaxID=2879119 RepID=UPI00387998C7